jgi:hypothetical protein
MSNRDALHEEQGNVTKLERGRKPRTLLASEPPTDGSSAGEFAAWLTVQLGLGADPILRADRFGHTDDSRFVFHLQSKRRITYDRLAELFDSRTLVRHIVQVTGATLPPYAYADALKIATVAVLLSELVGDDDDRNEAWEWAASFLEFAALNIHIYEAIYTPDGKWRALSAIRSWRPPANLPPYCEAAERAIVVADHGTGDRLVRTSDVAAHVRSRTGKPIAWSSLHGRMAEIGWEHLGQWEQRQPDGYGRLKAHLYRISGGWEQGD